MLNVRIGGSIFHRICACSAASGPGLGTGSTSSLWTGQERCDSSATPCTWKGPCAGALTSPLAAARVANSFTGGGVWWAGGWNPEKREKQRCRGGSREHAPQKQEGARRIEAGR